jgi:uncharacterized protein (DUF2141 family)
MRAALLILTTLTADGGSAADAGTSGVTVFVEVENLKHASGTILMSLHDGPATFPRKSAEAWKHERLPVTANPFHYRFENVPPGEYAVGAAHDENGNGKTDTGIFGIPIEGMGVSNNPFSLGPPSFDAAKFKVGTAPVTIKIRIRR